MELTLVIRKIDPNFLSDLQWISQMKNLIHNVLMIPCAATLEGYIVCLCEFMIGLGIIGDSCQGQICGCRAQNLDLNIEIQCLLLLVVGNGKGY